MKITIERTCSPTEMATEVDRRGRVIEDLEAEIIRLKRMVRYAYNSGFQEGMREHTSPRGGIPWSLCSYRKDVGDA